MNRFRVGISQGIRAAGGEMVILEFDLSPLDDDSRQFFFLSASARNKLSIGGGDVGQNPLLHPYGECFDVFSTGVRAEAGDDLRDLLEKLIVLGLVSLVVRVLHLTHGALFEGEVRCQPCVQLT